MCDPNITGATKQQMERQSEFDDNLLEATKRLIQQAHDAIEQEPEEDTRDAEERARDFCKELGINLIKIGYHYIIPMTGNLDGIFIQIGNSDGDYDVLSLTVTRFAPSVADDLKLQMNTDQIETKKDFANVLAKAVRMFKAAESTQ